MLADELERLGSKAMVLPEPLQQAIELCVLQSAQVTAAVTA
jgi:hypothetical protein